MARDQEQYVAAVRKLIAERIDSLREERDVSVNWLADFSGLSRGHVSRVLSGANVSIETLAKLANALDTPLASLLKIDEPPRPGPPASSRRRARPRRRST